MRAPIDLSSTRQDQAHPIASEELLQDWRSRALRMEAEVGKAVIGQQGTLRLISVALFARGHVLLEGDVGIGKTTILRAFSRAVGGSFERVEGTVDLMPADLVYHTYVDADGKPRIEPGPLRDPRVPESFERSSFRARAGREPRSRRKGACLDAAWLARTPPGPHGFAGRDLLRSAAWPSAKSLSSASRCFESRHRPCCSTRSGARKSRASSTT